MSNRSTEGSYSKSSRKRSRTRSRSPPKYSEPQHNRLSKDSPRRDRSNYDEYERNKRLEFDREATKKDKVSNPKLDLSPPPPPRISKMSFGMGKSSKTAKTSTGIQMKLNPVHKPEQTKKISVASAFANDDSDDEVEEMPAECRMRMRNIGRETPTSSGPNSFGKSKQGFCDSKKIFERNLKNFADDES